MTNFCQRVLKPLGSFMRVFLPLLYSMNGTIEITNHRKNTRRRKLTSPLHISVFIAVLRQQSPKYSRQNQERNTSVWDGGVHLDRNCNVVLWSNHSWTDVETNLWRTGLSRTTCTTHGLCCNTVNPKQVEPYLFLSSSSHVLNLLENLLSTVLAGLEMNLSGRRRFNQFSTVRNKVLDKIRTSYGE